MSDPLQADPPAPPLWRALLATVVQRAADRFPPAALAAAAVLAVVATVVLGGLLLLDRRPPSSPIELDLPRASTSESTGDSAATSGPVVVHAAGAVAQPGVYRMAPSSRVADLIDAAGGALPDADLDQLNLAARLADGDRVYVPHKGEVATDGGAVAGSTQSGVIDLNTASAAQLEELPGVGPATAEAIVAWRKQHGRFRSVRQLLEVRGIGEAKYAQLKDKVRVS